MMTPADRDIRQIAILAWVRDTFGMPAAEVPERVRRLVEEVVELAQAEGLPLEAIKDIAHHVYSKPPGEPTQEIGGVCTTLLAYCASKNVSMEACENAEFQRIQKLPPSYFRDRQNIKADAGIAVRYHALPARKLFSK